MVFFGNVVRCYIFNELTLAESGHFNQIDSMTPGAASPERKIGFAVTILGLVYTQFDTLVCRFTVIANPAVKLVPPDDGQLQTPCDRLVRHDS